MNHVVRALLGASLLGLVACGDGGLGGGPGEQPDVTVRGGLDRATFFYDCSGPSDPQCNVDSDLAPIREEAGPFPQIALGSRFRLSAGATEYPNVSVAPVSSDFLAPEGERTYLAKRAGAAAVVAQQADGTAIDFANIEVVAPSRFKILQATPQGDFRGANIDLGGGSFGIEANVQYTFKFRAVAMNDAGEILAGALPCEWTSSDPTIARIVDDGTSNIVTLQSGAPGVSEVTVTYGDFSGVVRVEVGQ